MKKMFLIMGGSMILFCLVVLPVSALTTNNVPYWDGVEYLDSSVWYDSINNFLGIGTELPDEKVHITQGTLLVDDPGDPIFESSVSNWTLNGACSVDVSGKYAFVTGFMSDGLSIINISDPANPVYEGVMADISINGAFAVDVAGMYAYVVGYESDGLAVINISDPTRPALEGSVASSSVMDSARSVVVSGTYAYVAARNSNSLAVIDVSDPTNPVVEGSLIDGTNLHGAYAVAISGNYAYVTGFYSDSLAVINISDPVNPTYVKSVRNASLNGPLSVSISGAYAYVASYYSDSLTVVDIANPNNPTVVGSVSDGANLNGAQSVDVSGKYAYVASLDADSVSIVDISDSTNPVMVGTYSDAGMDGTYAVQASGKYVYVASSISDSLVVLDVGGADIHAANIGSLKTDDLVVNDNVSVENSLSVGNGLNVGSGGVYVGQGAGLSVNGEISGVDIAGENINAASIMGGDILGENISADNINGGTISGDRVNINSYSLESGDASPEAGLLRFGDGTGWLFNLVRASDDMELLTVVDTGKVGINNSSPTEALDIIGNVVASGTVCDVNGCIGDDVGGSSVWSLSGDDTYYDQGNVGVGLSVPTEALDVLGNINASSNITAGGIICDANGCIGDVEPDVWETNGNNTYYSLGNVGVGTSNPSEALDVVGNISASGSMTVGNITAADITASGTVCDVNGCIGDEVGGSGVWDQNGNDAYYDTGYVGIGTSSPDAELHIDGEDGVLFEGTLGSGGIPVQDAGTRMMWYPAKAAFRAGNAIGSEWNASNTGLYSFASGYDAEASGVSSVAMGDSLEVTGDYSVGFGAYNDADGQGSFVAGWSNYADGNYSVALNKGTDADGNYSSVFGYSTDADAYASFVLGRYNVERGNSTSWVETDPLFVIGNGTSSGNRNDAFVVKKNGEIEITGDITSDGEICIGSGC
jgi:hypothetical protein